MVFLRSTVALTLALLLSTPSFARIQPIVWHTLDQNQGKFFESLIVEFNKANNTDVKTETGMELPHAIIEQLADGTPPDAVFGPSDLSGLAETLSLSEVPTSKLMKLFSRDIMATVSQSGKTWGAPVLDGNHLMLFYNKRYFPSPPDSIESAIEAGSSFQRTPIAWNFMEPYVFAAFLDIGTTGLSRDGVAAFTENDFVKTLEAYKKLGALKIPTLVSDGSYENVTKDFYDGKVAAAINGDWALLEARVALGESLGIAELPMFRGKKLRSPSATHAFIFPGNSLKGPNRKVLLKLVDYMQSPEVQKRFLLEANRIPVHPTALKSLPNADPSIRIAAGLLNNTLRIRASESVALTWPAMRKGLRMYMHDVKDAKRAAEYIQQMTRTTPRIDNHEENKPW